MKAAVLCLVLLFAAATIPARALTDEPAKPFTKSQCELVRKNILKNLTDESDEIRAGTIQLIIDIKKAFPKESCSYAVIPLLDRLKSDKRCEIRILAAQALYELDSDLGRFAVTRRAQFDPSDRVARRCATLARLWDNRAVEQPANLAANEEKK
jgi:hypothetical protein